MEFLFFNMNKKIVHIVFCHRVRECFYGLVSLIALSILGNCVSIYHINVGQWEVIFWTCWCATKKKHRRRPRGYSHSDTQYANTYTVTHKKKWRKAVPCWTGITCGQCLHYLICQMLESTTLNHIVEVTDDTDIATRCSSLIDKPGVCQHHCQKKSTNFLQKCKLLVFLDPLAEISQKKENWKPDRRAPMHGGVGVRFIMVRFWTSLTLPPKKKKKIQQFTHSV